jgi:Mn2+/Fe2+ NRAMP family transporter
VSKALDLVLGIVTSIGGFVEVGSISTAAQAGAEFGLSLLWAIAAATLFVAALAEMAGRWPAVGKRTIAAHHLPGRPNCSAPPKAGAP